LAFTPVPQLEMMKICNGLIGIPPVSV